MTNKLLQSLVDTPPERRQFKKIDPRVAEWRKEQGHLPPFLRDFHDQKEFFKDMHHLFEGRIEEDEYIKDISWVAGQVYTIDIFLWHMARFGYTLQKTRAKGLKFQDIK